MTDYQRVGGYGPESLPGHSGSETSEQAARRPGIGEKTMIIHQSVSRAGYYGTTVRDLSYRHSLSHGAASGALSRLHRAGMVSRLKERRGRQQVYVIPEHVDGREESPYRPNAAYRQDRKPMATERPELTVESITKDLKEFRTPSGMPLVLSDKWADIIAPVILQIVRKYR